jgi:hypothetical protein
MGKLYDCATVGWGKAVVCTARTGIGSISTERSALAVRGGLLESVAVTVKSDVPVVVGVPEMIPVPGSSESPSGSAPLVTAQEYGPTPPLAQTNPV